MKVIFLIVLLLLVVGSLTFVSCANSVDDQDDSSSEQTVDDVLNETLQSEFIQESQQEVELGEMI